MKTLIFLTVPGLRNSDIASMPNLRKITGSDSSGNTRVRHSFPAVTWPSQANMLTGVLPDQHGIVGNGLFDRDRCHVEMWTSWNDVIQRPQIWDRLRQQGISTAAWFPMLSKGCGADYVCMPAPIHRDDGSEEMWCYSKPQSFYGDLLDDLGHFPLKHFWGPLANIQSSQWIADSAVKAAARFKPQFFYIYLPHLDYAAQKFGPDSHQALQAVADLDRLLGQFQQSLVSAYGNDRGNHLDWLVVSEYVITAVDDVCFPNRILREMGCLQVKMVDGREHLDLENSRAWAMVDHQFSHLFIKDRSPKLIDQISEEFLGHRSIESVTQSAGRTTLNHRRSGDLILTSTPNSWQAYYWWNDDALAPTFASTVDIHQKPGYDPVELFFDFESMTVPLDASLVKGSHGYAWPAGSDHAGVLLSTFGNMAQNEIVDTQIYDWVMKFYGAT